MIALYNAALVFLSSDFDFQMLLREPNVVFAIAILRLISGVAEALASILEPK